MTADTVAKAYVVVTNAEMRLREIIAEMMEYDDSSKVAITKVDYMGGSTLEVWYTTEMNLTTKFKMPGVAIISTDELAKKLEYLTWIS